MEWLKDWAFAVCAASVLGAIVNLLAPEERYEKLMTMCVSVFVLFVAAVSFPSIDGCTVLPEFSDADSADNESRLEVCFREQTENYLADTADKLISARLEENEIFPEEIFVSMDTSEDGCISIGQVTIVLSRSEMHKGEHARKLIAEMFGTEEIYIEGGTDG